jgi:hypothetical protein
MEAVRKRRAKLEDASDWSFNASDMAMSGAPTFTYNKPVVLDDIGGMGLESIDTVPEFNVMSPDIEAAVGQNDGFFMLLFTGEPDNEYGFHAEFRDDTMIYGYANSLDELKSQVELLAKYIILPSDIPYDEFQADLDGIKANEDDETMDMSDAGADMGSMDAGADMSGSADMGSTQDMSGDGTMSEDKKLLERNMSYTRFQNTLEDLKDCYNNIEDISYMSADELRARKKLIELCQEIAQDAEYFLQIEPEDKEYESAMNEDSQYYTFSIPAQLTVSVMADSEELAKDILRQNSFIGLMDKAIVFARGDAEVNEIELDDPDNAI